jgi:HEPN domain-containing protein
VNRLDFQKLAEIRIKEAKVLLDNKCFEGAYYLAGYVVECALKACIAKKTKLHDFPPPKKVVEDIYTHSIMKLLVRAELGLELKNQEAAVIPIQAELGRC